MSTAGPNLPSTGASTYDAGALWSNVSNITVVDSTYADCALLASQFSDLLQATGFGFSIPSGATIDGIKVEFYGHADTALVIQDYEAKLLIGGVRSGANKATGAYFTDYDSTITYGSSSDLWSLSPSYSDVNASNFGFSLKVLNFDLMGSHTAYVDYIQITITYTAAAGSSAATYTVSSRAPLRRVWTPARPTIVGPIAPDSAPASSTAAILVVGPAYVPAAHGSRRWTLRSATIIPPLPDLNSAGVEQTSLLQIPPAARRSFVPRSTAIVPPTAEIVSFSPLIVSQQPPQRQTWRPTSFLVLPSSPGQGVCECEPGGATLISGNLQVVLVNRPTEAYATQAAYRAVLVSANLRAVRAQIECDC